jgi:hypothetical protein
MHSRPVSKHPELAPRRGGVVTGEPPPIRLGPPPAKASHRRRPTQRMQGRGVSRSPHHPASSRTPAPGPSPGSPFPPAQHHVAPPKQGSERAAAASRTPANPGKWKQSHTGIRASFAFEEHHLSIKVLRHEDQQLTQCGDTPPALVSGKKVRLVRARPAQLARQPVRRERGAARRGTGTFLGIVRLLSSDRFLSALVMGWGGVLSHKKSKFKY